MSGRQSSRSANRNAGLYASGWDWVIRWHETTPELRLDSHTLTHFCRRIQNSISKDIPLIEVSYSHSIHICAKFINTSRFVSHSRLWFQLMSERFSQILQPLCRSCLKAKQYFIFRFFQKETCFQPLCIFSPPHPSACCVCVFVFADASLETEMKYASPEKK